MLRELLQIKHLQALVQRRPVQLLLVKMQPQRMIFTLFPSMVEKRQMRIMPMMELKEQAAW